MTYKKGYTYDIRYLKFIKEVLRMPWCPKCKTEYRDGVTACPDCGSRLVEELPEAVSYTHLDVYKRQPMIRVTGIRYSMPMMRTRMPAIARMLPCMTKLAAFCFLVLFLDVLTFISLYCESSFPNYF